jgi:hypothetical protein
VTSNEGTRVTSVKLLLEEVQLLLDHFEVLFEEPSGLPPSRACDHEIPLLPGAHLVNIRPYRYPPALKNEIEK